MGGTYLNETLFRRRLRMSRMLGMHTSLHVVVQTLSKEFDVTPQAIYYDHANMHVWSHVIEQDKQLTGILRARLGLLSREALALALETKKEPNVKDKFVKIGAINSALKVTDREISLAQELGLIERKPMAIESNVTIAGTPFDVDPEMRKAILEASERQRLEKERQNVKPNS